MADEIAADVGRAALRTVQKRDAALDAAKRQARAERRAELAGVARGGEIFRLRLVVVIRERNGNGGERLDFGGGAVRQALTIRRTRASCGATGRLLQRFLDVSFQHHNQTLCNRDAKPVKRGKLFNSAEKPAVLRDVEKCSRNNSYIQVGLEKRGHICVGRSFR